MTTEITPEKCPPDMFCKCGFCGSGYIAGGFGVTAFDAIGEKYQAFYTCNAGLHESTRTDLCRALEDKNTIHSTTRAFVDFCDENLGPNADWPMRVGFDDDGSGKIDEFCRLLNDMKTLVKPKSIKP